MCITYLNDIVSFSVETNYSIHANSTTVHVLDADIGQCLSVMNNSLSHMYRWLFINKLRLCVSKTIFVIFHTRKQTNLNILLSITLRNSALEGKEVLKIFRAQLDEELK